MNNDDHKNTWEGFTKFVFGDNYSHSYSCNSGYNFIIKINMIVGSTKEDISLEKELL